MTDFVCQTCQRPFPRANAFCSRACSDTWRQTHPRGVVPIVPVLVALKPLLEVVPPLSPEEIARAAVFILCGKIMDVEHAIEVVRQQPWPVEDGEPPKAA